jgi:hypothetical protein
MPDMPQRLIVKAYAPARRWLTLGILLLAIGAGLYATFELGRYRAGHDAVEAMRAKRDLRTRLDAKGAEVLELQAKVVRLETLSVGQDRERSEVQRTIGELQAQVARLNQELAFYRGIVTQGANAAEVKIQQVSIAPTAKPTTYRVRLTLVQPVRPDSVVSGTVVFTVEGSRQGKPEKLDLAALTAGKHRELPFTFRYLESFDQEITLPEGLKPEQLLVEVRSNRRGVTPLQQSSLWNVEAT